ncbi:MAG: cation:dicarboxylase symporter family transporter [Bacteroidetes bacterium]|nr:cation:dicarboxylase symporter family transporter [Bacteroidota bacterium]
MLVFIHLFVFAGILFLLYKKRNLTTFTFAFLIMGILFGYDFPTIAQELKIISDIFLKLIKTIIAPLLFSTLVVGIAGHSNLKQVGRIGIKSIIYFEIVTTFALIIGLAAINITKAGVGAPIPPDATLPENLVGKAQSAHDIILHIFPENIAKSIAEGQVLQIVVFSILFGVGMAMVKDEKKKPLLTVIESISEVMFKFTHLVMYLAPLAVFGAIAYTVGKYGLGVFENLIQLLLTLYGALVAFVLLILLPIALLVKVPIKKFIQAIEEPIMLAFATASSESALPSAMENLEKFGVPRKIVAFVLPTGYSFNLDGTTLYLSLASVFVAQAAGVDLSLSQQIIMVLTLMLTSKGVAGVPRASLVILSATVASFHLPPEPILIILGIDGLMDMGRTAVNVLGNCLATVVVAKWEKEM